VKQGVLITADCAVFHGISLVSSIADARCGDVDVMRIHGHYGATDV
jgi:hypothetical protein